MTPIVEFLAFGFTPFMLCGIALPALASADVRIVCGNAQRAGGEAFPAKAVLKARLLRRCRRGNETVVAEQVFRGFGAAQPSFELAVPPSALKPDALYALHVLARTADAFYEGEAAWRPQDCGPATVTVAAQQPDARHALAPWWRSPAGRGADASNLRASI